MHHYRQKREPPAGLEPAIPGLGGRCLIHWATEATSNLQRKRCLCPCWVMANLLLEAETRLNVNKCPWTTLDISTKYEVYPTNGIG